MHSRVKIELNFEELPNAVQDHWNLARQNLEEFQEPQLLPSGTKIIDEFNKLGRGKTLLILGNPGSGKTTALLELAHELITSAERDIQQRIPIFLNLSSYSRENKNQEIDEWLIKELEFAYNIPRKISLFWLREKKLILLLDGLDEVISGRREKCLLGINKFKYKYPLIEIIVCSRINDYLSLNRLLSFQEAIYIKPLLPKQIKNYFEKLGSDFTAVRTLLNLDTGFQDLLTTPLMLSIVTLAYRKARFEDLPKLTSLEEHHRYLLSTYMQLMFKRSNKKWRYPETKAKRYLFWMAKKMVKESQTVFFIERMQPSWLETSLQKIAYAVIVGPLAGIAFGLAFGAIFEIWVGLFFGLSASLLLKLKEDIELAEARRWSWAGAWRGLGIGLIFGLSSSLIFKLDASLTGSLIVGLILSLSEGLSGFEVEKTAFPNQGIFNSAQNATFFSFILAIGTGAAFSLLGISTLKGIITGLIWGALFKGGDTCIKHLTLRSILYFSKCMPWNYKKFLDYATECIFLQKVGGGYIFIHRLLLEYFAELK